MSYQSSKPAGIKQIAQALGISIGTVDRALHARSGISPKTRARVLKMAEQLNYSPNFAARNLKLSRHLSIGVFLPEQIASFFDIMRSGMRDTASSSWSAGSGLEVTFHTYPRIGEGDIECLEAAKWNRYDGIVLAPGDPGPITTLLRKHEKRPPVVFVASDASRAGRLASVAVDATVSGNIAADLLGRVLTARKQVATITGDRKIQDHAEKLRGFAASLATLAPHLSLLPPIESHEKPKDAYKAAVQLFREHPALGGLYINTANSLPVLRAAEEVGVLGKVRIITTDLFPELVPMIESDKILASLYQRPYTQGRLAIEIMTSFLSNNTTPRQITRLAPHIVLRSNLQLFQELMDRDETIGS